MDAAGGQQNGWVVAVVAGLQAGGNLAGQIQAGGNLAGQIQAGGNLAGQIQAGGNLAVAGQIQPGLNVAVAGQVQPGDLQMILVEHVNGDGVIRFVARPAPQWAVRFNAAGVQLSQRQPADLSDNDRRNTFAVKLRLQNLQFVPEGLSCLVVRGGDTIEQVCAKLFNKLEATARWDHGRDFGVLFSTIEENPLFVPHGTFIAEVLKSHGEGGAFVELDCLLSDPNPAHGIFAIAPPA